MNFSFTNTELIVVQKIGAIADELGFPAYVVGGFVRDRLLNRPTKDMDVMCVGSGIKLAETLKEKYLKIFTQE